MAENRVQFNNIVQNQLPSYIREEFPLISEFLKQYYIGQEYQGAPIDLIQNIDKYIKLDETTNLNYSAVLVSDISFEDTTITIDLGSTPTGTIGFPDKYGLLKIDNEIITYSDKTSSTFTGCIRGFVGITSYREESNPENLVFENTEVDEHKQGAVIENLSCLFLKEFLKKTKHQLLPLLDDRELTSDLNQNLFIKQSKDFYLSRGTDRSFEILFKALYNEDVKVIKPRDFVFTPSNSDFRVTNDLVVEPVEGDPMNLIQATLFQEEYQYASNINKAYAPVTNVEKIDVGVGKSFYRISLDAGYNRDLNVDGAIYGAFSVHPKTRVIGQVSSGSSFFSVDSTVGFGTIGELSVTYSDLTVGIVSYTSKSLTEFYGCTNIEKTILDATDVGINTFAYGRSFLDQNEIITVRINSVLNKFNYSPNNNLYSVGDIAKIKTLGRSLTDFKFKNWFYNVASTYTVKNITLVDSSDFSYSLELNNEHYFRIGDKITLSNSNGISVDSTVVTIVSDKTISVKGQGQLASNLKYTVHRKLLKGSSNTLPAASLYATNVQSTYIDDKDLYVASSSIPSYGGSPLNATDRSFVFSGTFLGENLQISTNDHGFFTGDAVYYDPQKIIESFIDAVGIVTTRVAIGSSLGPNFPEGLYYIKRVSDNTVKFARSKNDILNSKFVSVESQTIVTDNKIQPYQFNGRTLQTQKLIRKVVTPSYTGSLTKTEPGFTGIFINGVEILNYKSNDTIYYGSIDDVEVISPGFDYDLIDPPLLSVQDSVGTGATGYVALSGSLDRIRVIDPGFDYIDTPTVFISGGNGTGAKASVNMKLIDHSVSFFAEASSERVGLGSTLSTIGFGTYHKFRNGERVIYDPSNQKAVAGIVTNSEYYVSVQDNTTIKLHRSLADVIAGINTVVLTDYGVGSHFLRSYNKKSVVESINVVSPGSGYQNKKRTTNISGISTSYNTITITNHDYNSGEIVRYTSEDTPVGALTNNSEYYVIKIDDNNFRLANVGISSDKDIFYRTNQYIEFSSVGVGTHIFNYPDISVVLSGKIGISSIGQETFQAQIQPIFRGQVTSVHLSNNGVGYGSSEIINFDKQPLITLVSGQDAQLQPIINNGRIQEILVLNSGKKYNSPPDLVIEGEGIGAVITPILSNGQITSVKVIEPGAGYSQESTSISVVFPGNGAEFRSNLQTWRINLFQRHFNSFTDDDGFITNGRNEGFGIQYSHLYAPRKLRQSVYAVDQDGKVLFGETDLRSDVSGEIQSNNHSPIIGWAYDGHPIYGPYGYLTKSGGAVTQMKSGYREEAVSKSNRPPLNIFPAGFFVEDFTYYDVSDESVLDENNGRFCITPEFPNGTYAYFATINSSVPDSAFPFLGFKRPVFPYLIGDNFKANPESFNFFDSSNQDTFDLNTGTYSRNTAPFNLIDEKERYRYFRQPDDLKQTIEIRSISSGGINNIGISTGGNNYRVNDSVVFNETNTSGEGVIARVLRIGGKSINNISLATSSITGVEFYPSGNKGDFILFCDQPHNFRNSDIVIITGLSTTSSKIGGSYSVGVTTNAYTLSGVGTTSSGIGTDGVTGIVTYLKVDGDLNYPNIRENDILSIGNEKVKVLNVEPKLSRIRVLRAIEQTSSAHTVGTGITVNQRKLIVNSGFRTDYDVKLNKQIYFNPIETVGLGTTAGVGIGTTIFFSNPGAGSSSTIIPTKTLYLPNHNLETGDQVTYSSNGGSGLIVSDETTAGIGTTLSDNYNLFVARISDNLIGLSTVRVGLGTTGTFVGIASTVRNSTTLFFVGIGSGEYHSLKTNYPVITGEVIRNLVTVSTAQTHGIVAGHDIYLDVNPGISSTFTLKYNDFNRKLIVNAKTFDPIGVDTSTNSITISNHGLSTGQKVIHVSESPAGGLVDNQIYYTIKVDNDTIKLANTYDSATKLIPSVVGISTTGGGGSIEPINPPLQLYKDSTVTFILTDPSLGYTKQTTDYPAFELNFYRDKNFTNLYDKNFSDKTFNVQRIGRPGVDANARVTLTVNDDTPESLYYKLDPIYESDLPITKSEINIDTDVLFNNEIEVSPSRYNGKHKVSLATTNTYSFTIGVTPESASYISSTSDLKYETDCVHALGPITKIEVQGSGKGYTSLPGITTVTNGIGASTNGTGAILEASSNSIGKIRKTKIQNIGFDFPSDKTLEPTVTLPNIIKIESLKSFDFIGITSGGRGYTSAPRLVVYDGKTDELINDVDLQYKLGDSRVTIFKNTKGINNVKPRIIPVQNTNGVGISTVGFNTITSDVIVTLAVGFSTADTFPFAVGDKVLVENVSVGIGSTGKGFNSAAYKHQLFTITAVDQNLGGIGATVAYNVDGLLKPGEIIGQYDPFNSGGRIIPEKYFPIFDPILKNNQFAVGETVQSGGKVGVVESWDPKVGILRVSSNENFATNDLIEGLSSKTQGLASSVTTFDANLEYGAISRVEKGSMTNSGFLNANMQRVQDSFYYQNFSYSLSSKVDYDTWNDVVSSTNHTAGFKKFSDYQLETPASFTEIQRNSLTVGLSTELTSFEVINDLYGVVDLNCVYNFDLAKENSLNINNDVYSDEIIFSSRILTDYFESFGNRVLSIDDFSSTFNSEPRATEFSVLDAFNVNQHRALKYFVFVRDQRFVAEKQFGIVTLLQDGTFGYMNQYGRIDTDPNGNRELGSFDFSVFGTEGSLTFNPIKYSVNDYNLSAISYQLDDNVLGVGSTNIGGILDIESFSVDATAGRTTLVSVANTYRSLKVLACLSDLTNNEYQYDEMNVIHDGSEVYVNEYGKLTTNGLNLFSLSGFGTYYPYISGSNIKIDFIPNVGVAVTANCIQVAISDDSISGLGTHDMKHARIEGRTTSIISSASPGVHTVGSYPYNYDAAYFIVQVSDTTNNEYLMTEILVTDDDYNEDGTGTIYMTEFGETEATSFPIGLGTFGTQFTGSTVELTFTPNANIATQVKVYMNAMKIEDDSLDEIDFNNGSIRTLFGRYTGTENELMRSFAINHRSSPVFEKYFDGSDSSIVSISADTITIPNHFYVTGEAVRYYRNGGITSSIGIGTTSFAGTGSTTFLPSGEDIFVVKVNDEKIKLATSAENALKRVPETIDLESVGIGTSHRFVATKQNAKVIVAIDNLIQSPVVATSVTTQLSDNVSTVDDLIEFSGITSFFSPDLIRINDEIMKIEGVGIGSTNVIRVRRGWLGTRIGVATAGDLITKVKGDYNIVDNVLNFVEAPYGNTPIGTTTKGPNERDWAGITTSSSFQGRVFMRSGIEDTSNESYHKNYIFDDISDKFEGTTKDINLSSEGSFNISGIADENAVILINDIFQGPGLSANYYLQENAGITSIRFTGTASSTTSDVNTANIPVGGVLVSLGSSAGSGYQPLISAGATVSISGFGTVQSVSVGNTGSGYRANSQYKFAIDVASTVGSGSTEIYLENKDSAIQIINILNTGSNCSIGVGTFIPTGTPIVSTGSSFVRIGIGSTSSLEIPSGVPVEIRISDPQIGYVNVGVANSTVGINTITHVGFSTIIVGTGHISTSVTITNPGSGYTSSIPPYVVIDDPLSYSDIPLSYVGSAGSGVNGTIDVVVGNGSSVIDFSISNQGAGYGVGEILTIPTGGATGIPTSGSFNEFQLTVQRVFTDEFSGWTIGTLQVLDDLSSKFDGATRAFNLSLQGTIVSIRSARGSKINVQDVLLVFVNDILQVPGKGYTFTGGSVITFGEAPKVGDTAKVVFYKGSGDTDVIFREIIETVKKGDTLSLGYDSSKGQQSYLQEDPRTVTSVNSTDLVETFPYFGPGNTEDETLERPIVWCRQTEDKIIDEKLVGKDRELYEPVIFPFAYITKSVGIGSTHIYVDRIRPLFNAQNENDTSLLFQNKIKFASQDEKVSAAATAIVSDTGTISSLILSTGGFGYSTAPIVSIGGTSQQVGAGITATASATIGVGGTVTTLNIINAGTGYTFAQPPVVLISPPSYEEEENIVSTYSGDSGIIVGFGTTTVGSGTTQFIFDLHIPYDSPLRDTSLVGTAQTISTINVNDYFIVTDSNVGIATTSIISLDNSTGETAGVGTFHIDNVYVVESVEFVERTLTGIGTTSLRRVFVNVQDSFSFGSGIATSPYFGSFSWGKIILPSRAGLTSYTAYTQGGVVGINTSMRVERFAALKFKNYLL